MFTEMCTWTQLCKDVKQMNEQASKWDINANECCTDLQVYQHLSICVKIKCKIIFLHYLFLYILKNTNKCVSMGIMFCVLNISCKSNYGNLIIYLNTCKRKMSNKNNKKKSSCAIWWCTVLLINIGMINDVRTLFWIIWVLRNFFFFFLHNFFTWSLDNLIST